MAIIFLVVGGWLGLGSGSLVFLIFMAESYFLFVSFFLNAVLIVAVIVLLRRLQVKSAQVKRLTTELSNDSLEHYLNQIKKRGFSFVLKPKSKK